MPGGRSRRSNSPARRPASICGGSSRPASPRPSTPASRTGAPASARSAPASPARRSRASSRRSPPSPMLVNRVERGRYLDSVALMRISRRIAALPGVEAAALMIGTPSNKALLREAGLLAADGETAEPNDLVVAVRGADVAPALEAALEMLAEKPVPSTERRAGSLRRAMELEPQANLALISVPG